MMENTTIEWTDHTFNPFVGCTKVSPGCDHCYAEQLMDKRLHKVVWGVGQPRLRTSAATWRDPLKWNARHAEFFATHERRQRVFCASLADVFDNAVDPAWRADLFDLIDCTPNLDWLLLTKRIGNVTAMLRDIGKDECPSNVWLGATIVNRAEMLRDAMKLLAVPARVHFWSVEPMLGYLGEIAAALMPDWVICGGESGPNARPMHPDWACDLRDQCAEARVPFLFKQWGEWAPGENVGRQRGIVKTADWFAGNWMFGDTDLALDGGHIDDEPDLYRVGKKDAGRHLDGRTHDDFPRPTEPLS
jgi:protein gp37